MELLAPAGSYESLIAAINAGADAVYMGGIRFGARAYADNPGEDRFIDGLKYAHRYGAKVYMTVNTLFKPSEISDLLGFIEPYYKAGVDAVIVQDLGVLRVLRREFPELPIHASTQMTITNRFGAKLLKELGVDRIVPARELSLKEIDDIKSNVDIEIETFVHGALCYSYSGQCLMSSFIGGRSGNRGRCAQPCRLEYCASCANAGEPFKLLSLKDLCSLAYLPQLYEAGIDSLKIEGRMKSPRYTAGVTSVWRKYIDLFEKEGGDDFRIDKKDMKLIADLFDRGGRTEGYYFMHNGPDMMAWDERADRRNNEELYSELDEKYVNAVRKIKLCGKASFIEGEPVSLTCEVHDGAACKIKVTVTGKEADKARTAGMREADIRKQLEKTGGSAYEWEKLDIICDDNIFVPVSAINELRRMAFEKIEEEVQKQYVRS